MISHADLHIHLDQFDDPVATAHAAEESRTALLLSLIPGERYIGEIGLDFMEKHASRDTWELQEETFRRICSAAAESSDPGMPKVLTVHSVRASRTVLEILRATGCLERCICILHWFSDSAVLLWDAIHAGCWFSLGERSLRTGKGREYIKLVPRNRLLLETDMPWPGDAERGFAAIQESISHAEEAAGAVLGCDPDRIAELTSLNARNVLSL